MDSSTPKDPNELKASKQQDIKSQNSSSDSEEDEGSDIQFPKESAEALLQFLHRELNTIGGDDPQKRKFALIKFYEVFVLARQKAPKKIYQELLPQIQKPLFKRITDKLEKNRELVLLIIKEFFINCDDLTLSFPYLFPILIERLDANDLEGTDQLPDIMKPPVA